MHSEVLRWPLVAVGVLALAPPGMLAQPIDPIVREGVTEKISAHVYVIPDAGISLVPNVGIIVGPRGTFVVDTGLGIRNGEAVVREMEKVKRGPELYLATTHFHPEHDLGAMTFPATTKLLRSADQVKDIDEFGLELAKQFSTRAPFIADLLKGAEFRKADTVFDHETTIDLGGGVRVRAVAMGANHTRGDTVFLVEPDGVLFSGDIAMKPQPSFASPYSTVKHWLTSLDYLEQLKPKHVVPSHGPIGDMTLVTDYRTYLTTVQTRTAELKKQGKTVDEAALVVAAEMSKYPDKARLTGAVKAAFSEAP